MSAKAATPSTIPACPPAARRWRRLRTLVVALLVVPGLLAVAPPPAEAESRPAAQARGPAKKKLRTEAGKKAAPPRKAPARKPATRAAAPGAKPAGKAAPPRRTAATAVRPTAAAQVMVHGALRAATPPGRALGRAAVELDREEATALAIEEVLRGPLRVGTTGLYVVDAATGDELFAVHPDDPLNPASNVKLISTAAAVDLLGPDFRYTTRVLGPAPDDHGVVAGDVYLLGTYDPTLTVDHVTGLARELAAAGITRIDGDVLVGPVSTRDGIYRSRVKVEVTAGAPGAAPAVAVTPATEFVVVESRATTGKKARVKGALTTTSTIVTAADGAPRWQITVAGTIGKGKRITRWLTTRERHLHTAHVLRAALRGGGVEVTGQVAVRELPAYVDQSVTGGRLPVTLAVHRSPPLERIIAQVNKRSINWLSDRVVATAAALAQDELPSMDRGLDAMYAWLARATRIERDDLLVDTGSGLSYRTRFSARQIVDVLRAGAGLAPPPGADPAHVAACAAAWRRSLAVAGVDGTLRHRFKTRKLRGRVVGKTGTLSTVIALSGLLEGPGGRTLAFALVTNGHAPSRKHQVRTAHEQVIAILDDYLVKVARAEARDATTAAAAEAAAAEAAAAEAAAAEAAAGDDLGEDDEGDNETDAPLAPAATGDTLPGPVTAPGRVTEP